MVGTESEDERHSTADKDPRPRLRRRFFASLVLAGLLVGLMLGRLTAPGPITLLAVEPAPAGVRLWFDREPEWHAEHRAEGFVMLFQAQGQPQHGRLAIDGVPANWRLQNTKQGMLLSIVATRSLRASWDGGQEGKRWWLDVGVKIDKGDKG